MVYNLIKINSIKFRGVNTPSHTVFNVKKKKMFCLREQLFIPDGRPLEGVFTSLYINAIGRCGTASW